MTPQELYEELIDAPCIFCGYSGAGYYQVGTHDELCPWHGIGGGDERASILPTVIANLHAARVAALRQATEAQVAQQDEARALRKLQRIEYHIRKQPRGYWNR